MSECKRYFLRVNSHGNLRVGGELAMDFGEEDISTHKLVCFFLCTFLCYENIIIEQIFTNFQS